MLRGHTPAHVGSAQDGTGWHLPTQSRCTRQHIAGVITQAQRGRKYAALLCVADAAQDATHPAHHAANVHLPAAVAYWLCERALGIE